MSGSDPTGIQGRETVLNFTLLVAKRILLGILYAHIEQRQPNAQRDTIIRERYTAGETISDLAREYGVSPQRMWQIIRETR